MGEEAKRPWQGSHIESLFRSCETTTVFPLTKVICFVLTCLRIIRRNVSFHPPRLRIFLANSMFSGNMAATSPRKPEKSRTCWRIALCAKIEYVYVIFQSDSPRMRWPGGENCETKRRRNKHCQKWLPSRSGCCRNDSREIQYRRRAVYLPRYTLPPAKNFN